MRHIVQASGPFEYFCRKVDIRTPDKCWEWKGSVASNGYGNWCHDVPGFPRVGSAHRRAYALFFEHPGRLQVNHRCGNRRCCNPEHLYAGTQKQNHIDSVQHGTHSKPPNFYGKQAKNQFGVPTLDAEKVREIRKRRANGESGVELALEFKVSPDCICRIYKRRSWAWVSDS
jgi:hypothetical protein